MVVKELLLKVKQASVIRGETLPLVIGKDTVGDSDDCGDEKGFVYIDTTTEGVNKFHTDPPP